MGQSETLYFSLFSLQYSAIQAIYMQLYSLWLRGKVTCINMVIRYQQWLTILPFMLYYYIAHFIFYLLADSYVFDK